MANEAALLLICVLITCVLLYQVGFDNGERDDK